MTKKEQRTKEKQLAKLRDDYCKLWVRIIELEEELYGPPACTECGSTNTYWNGEGEDGLRCNDCGEL